MIEKEIFSSTDESVVSRLCDIFENQGILYNRKDGGAGSYLSIAHGQDVLSQKKIFVSDIDYEKAKKLIDFLEVKDDTVDEDVPKALKVIPIEDEFGYGKYYTIKIIVGILAGTTFVFLFIYLIARIIMKAWNIKF